MKTKNILWAVDAFHENPKDQLRVARTLPFLFKKAPISIQPVSVVRLGQYDARQTLFLEKWSDLARAAQRNLDRLFKRFMLPNLKEARVIRQEGRSTSSAVTSLLDFARGAKSDLIVVSSHGRKGASRFFLGSFAETLVLRSQIPVLVVNPKSEATQKIKQILFPTDFSKPSEKAYGQVLQMAKDLSCKILLVHKLDLFQPDLGYPFVVPPVSRVSLKQLSREFLELGKAWESRGKAQGVSVRFYLANRPGHAVDEVLKAAKIMGRTGIIAMASQSGKLKSALLGSLTRQVLRDAAIPVLVIHPNQNKLADRVTTQLKLAGYAYSARPIIT